MVEIELGEGLLYVESYSDGSNCQKKIRMGGGNAATVSI